MRLLRRQSDGSLELTDPLMDNIPEYAILSHTWLPNNEEVNFKDIKNGSAQRKAAGFRKIQFCGEQAANHGLEYFWVDTCCIDKSSSAELQEAITAMFTWYHNATRCYVYLVDISVPEGVVADPNLTYSWEAAFRRSRWFTRGWTLQELIAPVSVEFFSAEGIRLGDKQSLEHYIYEITRIPLRALQGGDLTSFSVDERLSWAENRRTTRKEDRAYSLLGIFAVFMPLIYGEGDHAFARLREEIDKSRLEGAKMDHWLSKLPVARQASFNSHENQYGSTCLPETRIELLQDITEWVDGMDKRCIFWLNGIAGTGKSTVARTIARKYYDRGNLGASFFFSKGGGDVGVAGRLITTIASQLASRMPSARRHICEAIRENQDIATLSLRDQWDQLVIEPLSKLDGVSAPSTIVLVIDALDECESERDIRIILRLLATTNSISNLRLRVFITSRPEIPVRSGFSQIPLAERQCFVLQDISPTIVNRDLNLFFEHNFMIIREERGLDIDWPGMHIIRRLVEVSCGLFIWASTACRFIREGRRFAMRRISILINNHGSGLGPEKQLDDIYITVLKNSMQRGYSDEEKQELHETFRHVLGSIVILCSPLSIDALAQLLPLSSGDISGTLADMHTLFNFPSQTDGQIRLHHPTFRDFILNKDRCGDLSFWVDEQQAHKNMANNCIQIMSRMLKRDICGLQLPGTIAKDVDPELIEKCIPPALNYACLYWVHHYRKSGARLQDDDPAHEFFQHYFLYWVEAMILIGKSSEVAATIRMYAALIVPEKSLRQIPFVHDARRFFFAFQSIIEQAPLQTYCSGLAFIQRSNALRRNFRSQMHRWIQESRIAERITTETEKLTRKRTFFVNNIAFTPDGRQIASGSTDPEIRLWDVGTKATQGKFEGQTKKISSAALRTDGMKAIAVSLNGMTLASGSDNSIVTVWEWKTRAVRYTFREHTSWVNSVALSLDGRLLASGSMDETIRIWDLENGQGLCTLKEKGDSSCIHSVTWSPDGSLVASGSADQVVRLWDVAQRELRMLLDGHSGAVNSVKFSPNGKRIVSGADDTTIKLWDTATGTEYMTLRGHGRRVLAVAFSSDDQFIASGSEDRTVKIWDAIAGALLVTLSGHSTGINAVAFSPNGRLLASSSFNVELRLWDAKTGETRGSFDEFEDDDIPVLEEKMEKLDLESSNSTVEELKGHSSVVISVVFSPDGKLVVSGSHDATIKLWTRDGVNRGLLHGHSGSINCLTFSPDSHLIASASSDKTARIWNAATGKVWHTLDGHSDNVRSVRFSSDGEFLASCSADKTSIVWHAGTGAICSRLEGHSDTVNDIAFSPTDNHLVASCSADTTIGLWNVSTGVSSRFLTGHSDTVNSIAFSLDGKLLVSSSADTTIRLWNTAGSACGILKGHILPANSAALSPDNKLVVSCSDDETVRIWDSETELVKSLLECGTTVRSVRFSSCGNYIETDRGLLDTGSFSHVSPSLALQPALRLSFTAFVAKDWVRTGGENTLWLPEDYYATSVATYSEVVVLGHLTGCISFIYF